MTNEKFTPVELIACESYADNGVLSHYNFVDENGDIIGLFCDEDALIKNRMKREKAYANLFAAAPKMYKKLNEIANLFFTISYRMLECKENKNANAYMRKSMEIQKLLAEARGEE